MSDLISKGELFNRLSNAQDKAEIFSIIQSMPTKDNSGHWIDDDGVEDFFHCSRCGWKMSEFDVHLYPIMNESGQAVGTRWQRPNFCHNCGADMRGEENDPD